MGNRCPKCHTDNPPDSKFCKECAAPLPGSKVISSTETMDTPIEELSTGSFFADRYQIIEELGEGGMGRVYKVLDRETQERIALKLIKPEIASDKKTIDRFRNELTLARKITHRNICRMYDLNRETDSYYITMEYVSGQDLKGFIRQSGQMGIGTAISIAKQICAGLSEAHALGIVHRDLKSNNIMIDEGGNVRIMDFGIARSLKQKGITGAGIMIGTPEYMSPEQAEAKEVDHRSDIYSLGVILYEMVTGKVPFEGDTPLSIAMRHKGETPIEPTELNPQIHKDFNSLILKCLQKDRENRFQSAAEIELELQNIEKGVPTTIKTTSEKKPLTSREITLQFNIRKLLIPALAAGAVLIAAIMMIWRPWSQKSPVSVSRIENSLAVISFENLTGEKTYDDLCKAIPNLLITNLENAGFFYVATWERMRDLLRQTGKENIEIIDSDLGFDLCRMDGIASIVTGRITKAGDMFAIDVKVLDVETKKLLKSASSKGEGVDSIIKTQIDKLSRDISQGIGLSFQKLETAQFKAVDLTTNSMEAYTYFLEGRENKYYWTKALESYRKAVELDPTFASAYSGLALAYGMLGNTKESEEAIKKAKSFSGKATEREKLWIDARYAQLIEKNEEKRSQILRQIAKKYPNEKEAHYSLGLYYYYRYLFPEAIEEFNLALEIDPTYDDPYNLLGYSYAKLGDYEKGIEYIEKYITYHPKKANAVDSLAAIYLFAGRLEEAMEKYREVLEIDPDSCLSLLDRGYICALKESYEDTLKFVNQYIGCSQTPGLQSRGYFWKGFYHYWLGGFDQCLVELQRAEELAAQVKNKEWISTIELLQGMVDYERGEYNSAREHFNNCYDLIKRTKTSAGPGYEAVHNMLLGFIALKEGQTRAARSKWQEVTSIYPDIDHRSLEKVKYINCLLNGEILLAEGSADEVIAGSKERPPFLLTAMPLVAVHDSLPLNNILIPKDVSARAYQMKGDQDKAIIEYERLTVFDPDGKDRSLIHPKYHYKLALVYEQKGWTGKAIESYEKFLSLWKDADPGLAEVEDAKKRLDGLRNQ